MKDTNQSIFSQGSKLYFDRKCPSKAFQSWTWETILSQSKNADMEKSYSIIPKLVKETGFMM